MPSALSLPLTLKASVCMTVGVWAGFWSPPFSAEVTLMPDFVKSVFIHAEILLYPSWMNISFLDPPWINIFKTSPDNGNSGVPVQAERPILV